MEKFKVSENTPKMGRPSKYLETYPDELYEHMADGFSYNAFAGRIRVTRDCLYKWEKEYPEFLYAKKAGRDASLYAYEQDVKRMYKGEFEGGNATALVWYGKNTQNWTDKQEITQTAKIEISIDSDDQKL